MQYNCAAAKQPALALCVMLAKLVVVMCDMCAINHTNMLCAIVHMPYMCIYM